MKKVLCMVVLMLLGASTVCAGQWMVDFNNKIHLRTNDGWKEWNHIIADDVEHDRIRGFLCFRVSPTWAKSQGVQLFKRWEQEAPELKIFVNIDNVKIFYRYGRGHKE